MIIAVPLCGFGGDSKLSMELLWENASPMSAFGEQTLKLTDINGCPIVVVCTEGATVNVANIISGHGYIMFTTYSGDELTSYARYASINGNEVNFETCNVFKPSSWTTSDANLVPWKIYKIKGVSA